MENIIFEPTSSPLFKQMMTLFNQTDKTGYRHTYAFKASHCRTESTKELSKAEVTAIVQELKQLPKIKEAKSFAVPPGDQQRKAFFAIAAKMRWGKTSKELLAEIDKWLLNQKYKKSLNKLTVDELNKSLFIFEKVLADYYIKLNG